MNTVVNIGRTVARERRRVGITQEQLADHLGVSKAAVSKWELGQSVPDVGLLPHIAAYFSLTCAAGTAEEVRVAGTVGEIRVAG